MQTPKTHSMGGDTGRALVLGLLLRQARFAIAGDVRGTRGAVATLTDLRETAPAYSVGRVAAAVALPMAAVEEGMEFNIPLGLFRKLLGYFASGLDAG
jgi:hypothetical protein